MNKTDTTSKVAAAEPVSGGKRNKIHPALRGPKGVRIVKAMWIKDEDEIQEGAVVAQKTDRSEDQ